MSDKQQLTAKATELGLQVPSNATKAEIEALIAQNTVSEQDTETTEEEALPKGVFKSDNGSLYKFSDRTPATLMVDGKPIATTQLLTDTEVMEDLIASHCIFIIKLQPWD